MGSRRFHSQPAEAGVGPNFGGMRFNPVKAKQERLIQWLSVHRPLLVAFSGGVDSTFLLAQAHRVLGDEAVAATSTSSIHPRAEIIGARAFADRLGIEHVCLDTQELSSKGFTRNGPDRCYVCKQRLFSKMREIAEQRKIAHIVHGATVDDATDFRPGQRAADQLGILAPLAAVELRKDEIRRLSREMGLETWDRPAQACLASRIAYGLPIDAVRLGQVADAEAELERLGIVGGRVRHHGDTARIEVSPEHFAAIIDADARHRLICALRRLGFTYVALDLEGYTAGSLNRCLSRPGGTGPL